MQYLYTLANCANCDKAKESLAEKKQEYREVVIDNPVLEYGLRSLVGRVMAPVLLKEDGNLYFLVEQEDGKVAFLKLLV